MELFIQKVSFIKYLFVIKFSTAGTDTFRTILAKCNGLTTMFTSQHSEGVVNIFVLNQSLPNPGMNLSSGNFKMFSYLKFVDIMISDVTPNLIKKVNILTLRTNVESVIIRKGMSTYFTFFLLAEQIFFCMNKSTPLSSNTSKELRIIP